MVGKLASQIAGYKLSLIIAVLLFPFLFICYLTTTSLRADLYKLDRSIYAFDVHRRIVPLLFDLQGKEPLVIVDALKSIIDGSSELYVAEKLQAVRQLAASDGANVKSVSRKLVESIYDINVKLGMANDGGAEAIYLSNLSARNAPDVVMGFLEAQFKAKAFISLKDGISSENEFRSALGEWRGAILELQRQIDSAQRNAGASSTYQSIKYAASQLDAPYFGAARVVDRKTGSDLLTALPSVGAFSVGAGDVIAKTREVWEQSSAELGKILLRRQSELTRRLLYYVGTAVGVSLLGIGSAIYMFRSSFKRLDDLETSKVQAETAQEESEAMNRRLTTINNEIVHLNQELADKMRRLKDVQDELLKRGRLEQLGQLTATVAHELRNPLGAVRTSAFLLERKIKDKGLGVEAQLQRINNGISRCDSIITQLLDFSRTKQISAQPTNLDEWLVGIIEEEAKRLPAAVEIECALGLADMDVPFDPARLQRAVINLISNASEAMVGTGEDVSKFSVKHPKLSVVTTSQDGMAIITVSDNGPGISSDILEKIREPLFTTKSFGTGLGIPAVEQIATQHGGRLEISSEIGLGAKFSIYLPLASAETVSAA